MERYTTNRVPRRREPQWRGKQQKQEDKAEVALTLQTGICAMLFGILALCLMAGGMWKITAQKAVHTVFAQQELVLPTMAGFSEFSKMEPEELRQAVYSWVNQYIAPKAEGQEVPQDAPENIGQVVPVQGNASQPEEQGQGGWFPISLDQESDLTQLDALAPPKGATLAPVLSTAKPTAPVTGPITSAFGYRYHPITFEPDFHTGLDSAAPEGTAIHVALPGVVKETGTSPSYGNYIVVEHSPNFCTTYNHCKEIIAKEGTVLRKGDRIATVGSTGISTGPHVHFEVIVNGLKADPLWLL